MTLLVAVHKDTSNGVKSKYQKLRGQFIANVATNNTTIATTTKITIAAIIGKLFRVGEGGAAIFTVSVPEGRSFSMRGCCGSDC